MTNQEKKAYLSRYRDNEREIRRLQEEILRWESLAGRTTVSFGGAGGSNGEDRMQAAIEQIVALQNRLTLQLEQQVQVRDGIEAAIGTVPEERLRLLLRYRYIEGWTWERIAVEMNYAYRNVTRLHGQALADMKMS